MNRLLLLIFLISFSMTLMAQDKSSQPQSVVKFPEGGTGKNATYTFVIIPSINKTWGYDIYLNKKIFIHQSCIPGLSGNEGFKTKAAADTVAKTVIGKIKKGEMPPSVTIEELKKMKVL